MTDKTPPIDPIDAFFWQFSKTLRERDPEGHRSGEIAKKIRLAVSSDEHQYIEEACREALMNYQRKLMGTAPP